MIARLDPRTVVARLRPGRLGRPLIVLETASSTNAVAAALARRGERHGLVVVARRQTRGRGRQGRSWVSPPGGLYASVLLRPGLEAREAGRLGFAAAVAAATTLRDGAGLPSVRLDWPNDIVTSGRAKLGGILAESRAGVGGRLEWAVIGFGLNLDLPAGSLPPEVASRATSVTAEGGDALPDTLLPILLAALEAEARALATPAGWAALRERFRALATGLEGHPARFRRQNGRDLVGITAGIDADGGLRLRLEGGDMETVLSGERVHGID